MDGENAQGYATAFDTLVGTLGTIAKSDEGLTILLLLAVIGLAAWVWHLARYRVSDLSTRLVSCEGRHDACEDREKKNMLAIATLHGVVCSMQSALPVEHPLRRASDNVRIPSLAELLSGDRTVAEAVNPEVSNLET